MLLAIDAGNTNIAFALYQADKLIHLWRCKTDIDKTADEYGAWLFQLFTQKKIEFDGITDAIICSVVPNLNLNLTRLCRHIFHCDPILVTNEIVPLKTYVDRPDEIGADRLVNAYAATLDYNMPAIIIDFGTATIFDIVNDEGAYIGGSIAPGVNLSLEALHKAAAKLPLIDLKAPEKVIGTNTHDAMQSGIYLGYIDMIEGIIRRIEKEIDAKPYVIATGGVAPLFEDDIPAIETVDPHLTLRGLSVLHKNIQK